MNYTATSSTIIKAEPEKIWSVLMDPETLSQAFFGAKVDTDWQLGSPITWTGEWNGKPFHDEGQVRKVEPNRLLEVTHVNHVLTFDLVPVDGGTEVTINQTNAASP